MKAYFTSYFEFVAQTRILLASFILTVLFLTVIFPQIAGDIESLDVRTDGYDFDEVAAALAGYGEEGRRLYAWVSPTLDTLFPICYCSFYAGVLYRFAPHEQLKPLAYIPLIGFSLDIAENAQITAMLLQYPNISEMQVEWANRFTLAKFAATNSSMYLALAALALALGKYAYGLVRKD